MTRRPRTDNTPDAEESQRTARRAALKRLEDLPEPTASQRAARDRLLRFDGDDPATATEDDLRRTLGLTPRNPREDQP